jgi:DNA repair protein RadC
MNNPNPHYIGHRQRLRDRFARAGFEGLNDYEVVELLLTLAIPRSDVKEPAKELISRFGNLRGILDASPDDIQAVKGVGPGTPIALRIIRDAAALYLQQSAEGFDCLLEPERLTAFWRLRIGALKDEVFEVAYLDSACRLVPTGIERLEEGTVDRATVYPRRVMESALRHRAAALVLAHNHPNGLVQPTEQDKVLTRAIVLAAEALHLRIIDHLIVSPDNVFSFRKAGLM